VGGRHWTKLGNSEELNEKRTLDPIWLLGVFKFHHESNVRLRGGEKKKQSGPQMRPQFSNKKKTGLKKD